MKFFLFLILAFANIQSAEAAKPLPPIDSRKVTTRRRATTAQTTARAEVCDLYIEIDRRLHMTIKDNQTSPHEFDSSLKTFRDLLGRSFNLNQIKLYGHFSNDAAREMQEIRRQSRVLSYSKGVKDILDTVETILCERREMINNDRDACEIFDKEASEYVCGFVERIRTCPRVGNQPQGFQTCLQGYENRILLSGLNLLATGGLAFQNSRLIDQAIQNSLNQRLDGIINTNGQQEDDIGRAIALSLKSLQETQQLGYRNDVHGNHGVVCQADINTINAGLTEEQAIAKAKEFSSLPSLNSLRDQTETPLPKLPQLPGRIFRPFEPSQHERLPR